MTGVVALYDARKVTPFQSAMPPEEVRVKVFVNVGESVPGQLCGAERFFLVALLYRREPVCQSMTIFLSLWLLAS